MASQHRLDSLATDVAAVKACLVRVRSPAILVDETSQGQQGKFPKTDVFQHIDVTDGRVWLKPGASAASPETCRRQNRTSSTRRKACRWRTCSFRRSKGTAWKTKPSWYVVASQDCAVNPELQRFAASV
jgi:hypothetical protein